MRTKNRQVTLCLLLSSLVYIYFGYFLHRENFIPLVAAYLILFAGYIFLVKQSNETGINLLITAALGFRLLFLFSVPALSDDYFRFIWDGEVVRLGLNPFLKTPGDLKDSPVVYNSYLQSLFTQMNSPDYFSVYPPVMQYIFALASSFFPDNIMGAIVVLRSACILAEAGTIVLLCSLLKYFGDPLRKVMWYALNPLVIIELCGNLHFEAVMIFFLLLSIWFLLPNRENRKLKFLSFLFSAIAFGLSVCTKLIPLIFLPFVFKRLGLKKGLLFCLLIAATSFLIILPFFSKESLSHFMSSINLYFTHFEFNGSIAYIVRWIGFLLTGYDVLYRMGLILSLAIFIIIVILMIREKTTTNPFLTMQLALTSYLIFATTVHPWYIVPLILLSVFTELLFPIVWSLFIILSYSAYHSQPYHENLWFITFEYVALFVAMVFDFLSVKRTKDSTISYTQLFLKKACAELP